MHLLEADLGILMPIVTDHERSTIRYAGLSTELAKLSVDHYFADGHASFDADTRSFANVHDVQNDPLAARASSPLVRDLTMALDNKPLYGAGLRIVQDPEFNRAMANKARMYEELKDVHPATLIVDQADVANAIAALPGRFAVVKPVVGQQSKGVEIVDRETDRLQLPEGTYLVQDFIDTSRGIPDLGVEGTHNVRVISINGLAVAGIARVNHQTDGHMLKDDIYGRAFSPDELPESMHSIISTVHDMTGKLPGENKNVIAIDMMRGINAEGEMVDVLCEVNRRPMRISRYDTRNKNNLDNDGLLRVGKAWDKAEAAMLADMVV